MGSGFKATEIHSIDAEVNSSSGQYETLMPGLQFFRQGNNFLFSGDNADVMEALLDSGFQNYIDLIYADPPFFSNVTYGMKGRKENTPAFSDFTDHDGNAYLSFLEERLKLMHRLLKDTGSIFLHLDWHMVHHAKILMDGIFGRGNFRNEIIWHYYLGGKSKQFFARKHDNILFYSKSGKWKFRPQKAKRRLGYVPGLPVRSSSGKPVEDSTGKDEAGWYSIVTADDVWEISGVFNLSNEYSGYPTQKPFALLERIVGSATDAGDTVADFFSGSGTTLAVAQSMGRRWIGSDISPVAARIALDRILGAGKSGSGDKVHFPVNQPLNGSAVLYNQTFRGGVNDYRKDVAKSYSLEIIEDDPDFHAFMEGKPVHIADPSAPVSGHTIEQLVNASEKSYGCGLNIMGALWKLETDQNGDWRLEKGNGPVRLLNAPSACGIKLNNITGSVPQQLHEISGLRLSPNPDRKFLEIREFRMSAAGNSSAEGKSFDVKDVVSWHIDPDYNGKIMITRPGTRLYAGKKGGNAPLRIPLAEFAGRKVNFSTLRYGETRVVSFLH